MKREAIGHTKMKRLCRRLDLPLWQAIGLLESIWQLTAREAPRGDLGKLRNEDIALAIDYRGDEDAMIDALVSTGWLNLDPEARLVVHDWADHADDAVHMRLARARHYFVGGRAPKLSRLTGKEREAAHEYYQACAQEHAHADRPPCAQNASASAVPEPRQSPAPPEPEPEPEPAARRTEMRPIGPVPGGVSAATWDEFQQLYAESGKPLNETDWTKAAMEAASQGLSRANLRESVMPALRADLSEWAEREIRMVPMPANWLRSKPWTRTAKQREPPLTREQRRQAEIDREWQEIANATREK